MESQGEEQTSAVSTRSEIRVAAHAAVILTGVTGINAAGNLVVHALTARAGGVDSYGGVGALLSLGVIAATVASGVQYAVTRRASLSAARSEVLLADGLFAALPWLALIALGAAFSPAIAGYLKLGSSVPVLLALGFCATLVLYAIPAGMLVGRRRIAAFGVLTCTYTAFRVIYGFLLGWGAADGRGALASSGLAALTATILGVMTVVGRRQSWAGLQAATSLRSRLALTAESATGAVLSAALWGMWTAPVLLARHFLTSSAAGDFAAAQLMASAVLFLTAGVATAFYPSIVRSGGLPALVTGLFATVAASAAAVLVAIVLGPVVIDKLYGNRFTASRGEFVALGASVIVVAALTYLLWASQALQRHVRNIAATIAVAFVVELVIGDLWHSSAAVLGIGPAISCALGVAAALAIDLLERRRRGRPQETVELRVVGRLQSPAELATCALLSDTAVGVMVHNEATMIGSVLDSILQEVGPGGGVSSVVVVASACTDGTEEIVRDVASRDARVRLLTEPQRGGKAAAINWFLRETTEPICVLIGGDILCAPGSLAQLVAPLADPTVGMTGAHVVPTNPRRGMVGRAVHVLWEMHHQVSLLRPKLGEAVAFRRVVDSIDANSLVDEVSLEAAVLGCGYTLQYVPDAIVYNHGASTIADYLSHRRRIHRGHLGVQSTTGYTAATADRKLIVTAMVRGIAAHPMSVLSLGPAAVLEVAARQHAWRAHRLAMDHRAEGVWTTIASAKRTFNVEYEAVEAVEGVELVGHWSPPAEDLPPASEGV